MKNAKLGPKMKMHEHRYVSHLPLSHIGGLLPDIVIHMITGSYMFIAPPDAL